MDAPQILSVEALEDKKLLVKFINGVEKIYDCKPLLSLGMFELLKNEAFFKAVKVDAGGYGISWNDDADLSEYELWTNAVEAAMLEESNSQPGEQANRACSETVPPLAPMTRHLEPRCRA